MKLEPLNAEMFLQNFKKVEVEVVFQDGLSYVIWKDLKRPQHLIQSPPQVYFLARMVPPPCKKRPGGWIDSSFLVYVRVSNENLRCEYINLEGLYLCNGPVVLITSNKFSVLFY